MLLSDTPEVQTHIDGGFELAPRPFFYEDPLGYDCTTLEEIARATGLPDTEENPITWLSVFRYRADVLSLYEQQDEQSLTPEAVAMSKDRLEMMWTNLEIPDDGEPMSWQVFTQHIITFGLDHYPKNERGKVVAPQDPQF